jgi:hypothetical protein
MKDYGPEHEGMNSDVRKEMTRKNLMELLKSE